MTNRDEPVPPDQLERAMAEVRKLSLLIDELQSTVDTARGLHAFEARMCLNNAATRAQESGFWIGKAVEAARKAGH